MAVNQQEAEKTERKLRPLYDAVDNGQNKKAVQLADKILKKQDDLQCARALKAIALLRMGRQEEAVSTMNTVLGSHPGDQATLQACTMYFKENSDYLKIAEMYADAAAHYPKNQEILTHLFMAYVRVGDYQKQQHTAIQLHKAFPESGPYYCWRVMSILMQATDSKSNGKANQLFLPLAEKLIDKYFAEKEIDSEAEVRLYLMVLDKLNKTEKKLRVLDGAPGDKLKNRDECKNLQVECLLALEQWERAATMLGEMIRATPDQWIYIQHYISCQVKRCKIKRREEIASSKKEVGSKEAGGEGDQPEGAADSLPHDCGTGGCDEKGESWSDLSGSEECLQPLLEARDLLESLAAEELKIYQSSERSRYIVRGPLLGRMELVRQLYANGMHKVPLKLADVKDILMDYFTLFGAKTCMFDDLCLFLDVFDKIDREVLLRFVQHLQQVVNSEPVDFLCPNEDLKKNIDRLQRFTNLLQVQSFLNCLPMDEGQLLELCLHYHKEGQKLSRDLISTSGGQPRDFYALMAAHIRLEQYHMSSDISTLWDAIFLLERAKNSNPQISLLLMKLYGMLGGIESITELFKEISIKHLQLETIGYIPMRYIQSMGTFGFANQMYKSTLRFYYGASKDFSEYIIQAYRNGAFTKIEEFVDCRDRLTHSFNFVNTLTEMNILEMTVSVNSLNQAVEFFKKDGIPKLPCSLRDYVSSLVDNRDLTVFEDWSPAVMKLSTVQFKASFELECLWLRTRLSLVRSLGEAVALTSQKNDHQQTLGRGGEGEVLGEVIALARKVEEYRATLEQMDQHVGMLYLREVMQKGSQIRFPIQHPPPCLGYFFLQQGHGQAIFNMLRVTLKVVEGSGELTELLKGILSTLEAVKCQLRGVPDNLRQSLQRITDLPSPPTPPVETEGVEKEAESEHPYDVITRVQIDLEPYVLLLQSISTVLLLCMVCAEVLVPSNKSQKKKKKKKAVSQSSSASSAQLRDFVAELQRMLTSLCQFFRPLPLPDSEEELIHQLKTLYLGEHSNGTSDAGSSNTASEDSSVSKELEMRSRVCGTVLTSYDMSLRDTMMLASSKLGACGTLIQQLGGGRNSVKEEGNLTASQ